MKKYEDDIIKYAGVGWYYLDKERKLARREQYEITKLMYTHSDAYYKIEPDWPIISGHSIPLHRHFSVEV